MTTLGSMFRSKIGLTDYVPQRIDVTDLSDSMNALYRPFVVMAQMPLKGSNYVSIRLAPLR